MRVKTPDPHALETLKTKVVDPIVAGDASIASGTSNTGITGNTVELKKFTIRIDPILLGRIRAAYLNEFARGGPHRPGDRGAGRPGRGVGDAGGAVRPRR